MNSHRQIVGCLGVFCWLLVLGAMDANAQRSGRIDFGGWSGYDGDECADPELLDAASGNQVTLGSFTLAGYDPIWGAGSTDSVGCQVADPTFSDPFFSVDLDLTQRNAIGLTNQTPAKRYSFFTESNIFALNQVSFGSKGPRYMYQWEIWYFNDAIVASLLGPFEATVAEDGNSLVNSFLTISDDTTYLTDGTITIGGGTKDFGSNFLCFSADASRFNGVKSAADLASCRVGGDDGDDDVSEVPAPGTLGLLGVGIAALGAVRRRRRG